MGITMNILSKAGTITPEQDKTNISLDFNVPEGVKRLKVEYSYSPKEICDRSTANALIVSAMKKYDIGFANPEAFLPVKNLITPSFNECGEYRGACHRQANRQTIIISDSDSTPGIINRPLKAGNWDIVLNIHFVGCSVDYSIEIYGEVE